MVDDVKKCVDVRVDFFDQYYTIPQSVQGEADAFFSEINDLGERCSNAVEFEEAFVSTGLADKFYAILPKCTPKPKKMTKEEKQYSRKVAKEILKENKEQIIGDAVKDVADTVRIEAESELIAQNRKRMIEEGTYDDYTIARNYADTAKGFFRFLGGKFGKK